MNGVPSTCDYGRPIWCPRNEYRCLNGTQPRGKKKENPRLTKNSFYALAPLHPVPSGRRTKGDIFSSFSTYSRRACVMFPCPRVFTYGMFLQYDINPVNPPGIEVDRWACRNRARFCTGSGPKPLRHLWPIEHVAKSLSIPGIPFATWPAFSCLPLVAS